MKKQRHHSPALNDYSTSRQDNLYKHLRKRHNSTAPVHNTPPKIARHEPIPNIIDPPTNDHLLQDIEHQELSDMSSSQVGFGVTRRHPADHNIPYEIRQFFRDEQPWEGDVQSRDVYFRNFNLIHDSDQVHRKTRTYNRYLNGEEMSLNEAMEHAIEQVYRLQNHSFKINLSFSAIFQNRETQEYKFYYASKATKLLDKPILIHNQNDLNDLLNFLSTKDFPTHLKNQRPNTKWVLERIVNLQIRAFPTTYPLGNPPELPGYIKNNPYIIGLEKDTSNANR